MNPSKRYPLALSGLLLAQLLLLASPMSAQTAAAPTPEAPKDDKDVIVLSPFQVVADNRGYYSANTMSGTRFNTKLDDLASSVTVMTKQQMSDFAMLDMNDVFLYVAGTEGTGTFTDFTLDRNGSIGDNVQNNPTQANRVRGIAPANISLGNIETMGRVPVDTINVESVEISRGPNANVFGLGNPSGTVNMVPVSANLTTNRARTELRADSYGGWRTSLDVSRVLIPGKLAIRGSGVFQHDAFQRKPSGFDTERYNAMIKYQPFKYTTLTASYSTYHAYGNRANSMPPRDNISYWIANGRPTWDPVTQTVHNGDGTVWGTYPAAAYNGPDVFTASYLGNDHSQMFIDQDGLAYWAAPRGTTSTAGPSLATLQAARYLQTTAAAGATFSGTAPRPFAQYLFNTTPTISDKNIYDYESINLSAPNRFWDKTKTTNVSLDQMFINSQEQTLAAQLTFMREDSQRWSRNLVGIVNDNGQSGQLMVDINERRLDGTANPFFLRPYLSVDKPRTASQPQQWDTSRAQVAYRLDLTKRDSWLKHLGWFQLTSYGEYKYRVNRQYSWRDAMISNAPWLATGLYRGYQSSPTGTPAQVNLTQGLYRFYVGDKGTNIDYAPGDFSYGQYPFVWGNAATGAFINDTMSIGQVAADKTGGNLNTKTTLKTIGAVIQNHLFGDRLVTTFGARHDDVNLHFGTPGVPVNGFAPDGIHFDYALTDGWSPTAFENGGRTTNVQFVARPFMNTGISNDLEQSSNRGKRFFGSLLNGLSLNYNKSNSFLPTNPAQDLFKNLLPNTTGTDKSWGFGLNLFDGKLVVRGTHYDNFQKNSQTTDMNTVAGRVLRIDFATLGAGNPTPLINLYENAKRWITWANPTWSADQVIADVEAKTKISSSNNTYYNNATPPIGATSDIRSYGNELEFNVNPNRYWTINGSVTQNNSTTQNISASLVNWINDRMSVWTTIVDPSITDANAITENNPGKLWWKHRYANPAATSPGLASFATTAVTPEENFKAFVSAPFAIMAAQEGKNNPQVRKYNFRASTSYQLAGLSDNKWLKRVTVGGAIRWEDKAAIGYYGVQSLPAIITDLDPDRPIYDKAHYYVDMFVTYKTKLWNDKVGASFQVNVRNLGENGRLQPVGAFPDGTIHTYRIIDPQQFFFTASFDL